jgi:hypothetical protein
MTFSDSKIAAICNSHRAIEARWGKHALDVQLALSMLASCSAVDQFEALPNVTTEGDLTMFDGRTARITLTIGTIDDQACVHAVVVASLREL